MNPRRRSVRPALQPLDARELPANLTVTFAAGTLTVVGDANNNDVTVKADPTDKTHFTLTSTGTFNHQPSPFSSPAGVKNLVFKMLAGDDAITFDNTKPITVEGSVSINGGDGANVVTGTDLTVLKSLTIANGTATSNPHKVLLQNLSVGGNVSVTSVAGDTQLRIDRLTAGVSTIKGNLTVTNGTGDDQFRLDDTNVDGSVTVNNGHCGANGFAGLAEISNALNYSFRSVIGKNLTVTYLDGNVNSYDALWDTEVLGNATFNHGPGAFETRFDGFVTSLPTYVHGSLSILGSGKNTVEIGSHTTFGNGSGLVVGKKFTLTSGGGSAENLYVLHLQVGGNTSITLNDGGNLIQIDDSIFGGTFTLRSGAGADTIDLETTAGTETATEFKKAVLIDLGAGFDTAADVWTGANTVDQFENLVIWGPFLYKSADSSTDQANHEFFPNGGFIHTVF